MKLSLKQVAIFGQVKVNIKSVDSNITIFTTLLDLYNNGWWVTDRFGTIVTLVRPKAKEKDGFCCVCRRIYTSVNLDTLDLLTKQIADMQYEKYQNRLKAKEFREKIKKSKENYGKTSNTGTGKESRKNH